jgi:undecaprenyl-diphosphatase
MVKAKLNKLITAMRLNEFRILAGFFILAASLFIFVQIADEVAENEYLDLETRILYSMRESSDISKPVGPEWLPVVMRDVTALGGETVLALVTIFIAGFLYLKKEKRSLYYIIAASIGGAVMGQILKLLFFRERPDVALHLMPAMSKSFPSGHSMMSAAIYLSLAALLTRTQKDNKIRVYIISAALLLSFLVGISRIYLGVHYPTDVLAGWTVGLAWAVICWLAAKYMETK